MMSILARSLHAAALLTLLAVPAVHAQAPAPAPIEAFFSNPLLEDATLSPSGRYLVVYPEEGHGWSQLSTRVDFWGRVEKFLDKHIGAAR